jgi:hypothetical protein
MGMGFLFKMMKIVGKREAEREISNASTGFIV